MTEKYSKTVLIVDDDTLILRLIKKMLLLSNYRLLFATSAEEALELIEKNNIKVDLLLTDVIMAELNGRELADTLKVKWPEMLVVYMSGYSHDIIADQGVLEPDLILIHKPIRPAILKKTLREILGE